MKTTIEEVIQTHKELHRSLDSLIACYIQSTGLGLQETNLMDFIKWSFEQTKNPACFKDSE